MNENIAIHRQIMLTIFSCTLHSCDTHTHFLTYFLSLWAHFPLSFSAVFIFHSTTWSSFLMTHGGKDTIVNDTNRPTSVNILIHINLPPSDLLHNIQNTYKLAVFYNSRNFNLLVLKKNCLSVRVKIVYYKKCTTFILHF